MDHIKNETFQFHEMGLDDRLLKGIAKLEWKEPTLIQEKAIPLILEGKDVLARARTGSGKTAAFAIPAIQKILNGKQTARVQSTSCLVLAPSKELARQIQGVIEELTRNCGRVVRSVDVSAQVELSVQRPLLDELPDVVVGTPSRVLSHLEEGNLKLRDSLELLVVDEADLMFGFGFEDDLKKVLKELPAIYQAILTSATLTCEVDSLKKLVLHNPVVLKLEESQLPDASQLTQYHIKVEEEEKFTLIYALFKLKLIRGKSILFVNNVDRCYQLKLFLEQFGIPVCVLNSELPMHSRCHIISQFNQGKYDIIVASDEKHLFQMEKTKKADKDKKKSKRKNDKESGSARGIDFQFVSNVVNFDFPRGTNSYVHRIGRTARGNNQGTALSFVGPKEEAKMAKVEEELLETMQQTEPLFKPYQFRMEELDGFKYRARDAWRAVTKIAVREARLKEIKQEILNSQKLKTYFAENPRDREILRHDKALHTVKHQSHLSDVPDYIIPKTLKKLTGIRNRKKRKGSEPNAGKSKVQKKFEERKADPLKSFKFSGFNK